MTEEELYAQFENGTLDAKIFDHSNHIKMAWIYLRKFALPEAMSKFSRDLKDFARKQGATNLYHETITFAFLILINERMRSKEIEQTWEEFKKNNTDLFDWKNSILKKFYLEETIKSKFAKKVFVFPDKF